MQIIWIGIIVAFGLLESITVSIIGVWFVLGAILSFILSLFGLPVEVQVASFLIFSILMLIFMRPILKDKLKVGIIKTNVDAIAGETGIVIQPLEKFKTGQVKIKGQVWTADTEDGHPLEVGTEVTILRVQGVKVIVKAKKQEEV